MRSVEEHQRVVAGLIAARPGTEVPLADAEGLVLAVDVVAPLSLPVFDVPEYQPSPLTLKVPFQSAAPEPANEQYTRLLGSQRSRVKLSNHQPFDALLPESLILWVGDCQVLAQASPDHAPQSPV